MNQNIKIKSKTFYLINMMLNKVNFVLNGIQYYKNGNKKL